MTAVAPTIDRSPSAANRAFSRWVWVAVACVVLAALSLVVVDQTTYDPTAWLIWGREIVHGDLSTTGGPSWKPLPILVTAPAALLGDAAQRDVWLVVARTGTLGALLMTYRLAWRLEGPVAGAIAAGGLVVASGVLARTSRGDSEGLLVAVGLGAIEAHLAGRRWTTFGLLFVVTLLRPEFGLFAGAYGLGLVLRPPPGAGRGRTLLITGAAGAVTVAAWLIPERIGSGHLFRAASRALEPVAGSPATADHPFIATFTNGFHIVPWPFYAVGVAAVAIAVLDLRRGGGSWLPVGLAALSTALMALVALMAEAGFTGNIRYLTLPAALVCVLAGAGAVRLAEIARSPGTGRRVTVAVALGALVAAPFLVAGLRRTGHQIRAGLREASLYAGLPVAVERAGGAAAIRRCGRISTAWYDTQAVARALHVHQSRVALHAATPGTIVVRLHPARRDSPRFPYQTRTPTWHIQSTCAP